MTIFRSITSLFRHTMFRPGCPCSFCTNPANHRTWGSFDPKAVMAAKFHREPK